MSTPPDIHDRVHAFADGELPPDEADAFRLHLGTCERCQAELGDILQMQVLGERLREEEPSRPRVASPAPRAFRPAWHRRQKVVMGLSLVAALVAVFLVVPEFLAPSGPAPAEMLALAPTRSVEVRLSYAGASGWRSYDVKRSGDERPSEPIPQKTLAKLEEQGDWHGLAVALLLGGMPEQAAEKLGRSAGSPDVDSDRAAVALSRGALEDALVLLDGVLARAPRHPQALWNRGLVLRELGLNLLAAEAFSAVAGLGEPGWSDEARQRAESLRSQQQAVQRTWSEAWRAGIALALEGTPLPEGTARAVPGIARTYLYQALWAAPSAERVRALLPLARELDRQQGHDWLERYVSRVAARDFRQRAPLAERFGQLLSHSFPPEQAEAYLDALRRSGDTDILLGALPLLQRLPARLADYEKAARTLGDPWFLLAAELEKAKADLSRNNDLAGAEKRLIAALETCRRERMYYRCLQLESQLVYLYTVEHRLVEAREHAGAGLQLARQINEAGQQNSFLQQLGDIAAFLRSLPLARAYLREQALRLPEHCPAQDHMHERLASLHILELAPQEARAELEAAGRCGEPLTQVGANTLADLARMEPHPGDVERVKAVLDALRARGTLRPAELAVTDCIEGRALIERDAPAGRALLRRAIAAAEALPLEDLDARKARSYSYSTLLLEAGRRGAWAEALALFAEEQGAPEPGRCTLGVELHDERTVVVARGAEGREVGHFDGARTSPGFEVERLVPAPVLASLEGCEHVGVFARSPVHGKPGLLPPRLAWSYVRGRAPESRRVGGSRQLVVSDVEAPRSLALPRLQAWRALGDPGGDRRELRGAEATPSRVLAELADATEVEIHAHGLVNLGISEASLLVLSPEADGRYALTAGEVRRQRLSGAPVVLLAACRAAEAAPYLHAPWSLPVAFLEAGARAVIASPVAIPDAEAGAFFEAVLARVRAGTPAAAAVRDERQRLLGRDPESWVRTVVVFE